MRSLAWVYSGGRGLLALWVVVALAACSGDEPPVMVGGSVAGLKGTGLVLTNNGRDDLAINGDGEFVFATPVERQWPTVCRRSRAGRFSTICAAA